MSKAPWKKSLKIKLLQRIQQLLSTTVLREELADLGSSRQVSRALNALIEDGELVKIGYGVYVKAYRSPYINNRPVMKGGFELACKEALNKLGIQWEPSWAEKAYNEGTSTQVPVNAMVRLKSRFKGHPCRYH